MSYNGHPPLYHPNTVQMTHTTPINPLLPFYGQAKGADSWAAEKRKKNRREKEEILRAAMPHRKKEEEKMRKKSRAKNGAYRKPAEKRVISVGVPKLRWFRRNTERGSRNARCIRRNAV
ncbi:TPA: hypothetical protein L4R50_000397 [Pseudomonas aeruginosa]|nr:hypothetical protein [Pseudomonas aeruginosa]